MSNNNPLVGAAPELANLTFQNYLDKRVRAAIQPEYVWSRYAATEVTEYPTRIGVPEIISVRGLRAPKLSPNDNSNVSDLLAGMSANNPIAYEQFSITVNRFDDLAEVDLFARHFPIVDQFAENVISLAQGAAVTEDWLARNALYQAYTSAQTFITAAVTAGATSCHVDDIRGFVPATGVPGQVPTQYVNISGASYQLSGATADGSNTSGLAFEDATGTVGISGTLTFTSALPALAEGVAVVAAAAPKMIHANSRTSYTGIQSGDLLTANMVIQGRKAIANNGLRGEKVLIADADTLAGLYQDSMFQNFYRGAYDSSVWENNDIVRILGCRVVEVTSMPQQINTNGVLVKRPIIVHEGALSRANMTATMLSNGLAGPVHHQMFGNIGFTTRAPIDAAGQMATQAYLMWLGFAPRTDRLVTPTVIPTASFANYKRACVMVCAGLD